MENNLNKKYVDLASYTDSKDIYLLDGMVLELIKAKFKGDLVSYNFDGNMFYSDTVTLDGAYLEYYDMSKKEYDYYVKNAFGVMREILMSSFNDLMIDDSVYKYAKDIILTSSTPTDLQTHHLLIKALTDLFAGLKESESINRFKKISDKRKVYVRSYIEEYFRAIYKEDAINLLGLNELTRKRENNE